MTSKLEIFVDKTFMLERVGRGGAQGDKQFVRMIVLKME